MGLRWKNAAVRTVEDDRRSNKMMMVDERKVEWLKG